MLNPRWEVRRGRSAVGIMEVGWLGTIFGFARDLNQFLVTSLGRRCTVGLRFLQPSHDGICYLVISDGDAHTRRNPCAEPSTISYSTAPMQRRYLTRPPRTWE
jgi:hypothetical protein